MCFKENRLLRRGGNRFFKINSSDSEKSCIFASEMVVSEMVVAEIKRIEV